MSKNNYTQILVETREPGIRIVRINRPQALNALNTATLDELKRAFLEASTDTEARVVVLTGAGDKSFIAGADIAEMKDKSPSEGTRFSQLGHEVAKLLDQMAKPTIAAVNGFALGGGTEMAVACDFIVASDKALFGQPEVGLGIIPGFGATFRLARFVGLPMAKELIFSGRRIKADEALALGLVNHVYPAAEFEAKWMELAQSIAQQSYLAVSTSKRLINELAETQGLNYRLDAEAHAFGRLFGSADQREGMGAFVEKRKAKFEGLT